MDSIDYYRVLQVDPLAEPEVIEAAYRRLVMMYHPDANRGKDTTRKMQDINSAYAVLGNPNNRKSYDLLRMTVKESHYAPSPSRKASIEVRCQKCSHMNEPSSAFCSMCGAPIGVRCTERRKNR